MTKLTMPEPAAWLVKSASFQTPILQAHKPTMVLSDETITPLYTAEALRDVLEQAAKACDECFAKCQSEMNFADVCADAIRAMMEEAK